MENNSLKDKLRKRWDELMQRLACENKKNISDRLFDWIVVNYSKPHRAYHNLDHIQQCLDEFDHVRLLAKDANAVELAIWYHDVVYDPERDDNEERSSINAVGGAALIQESDEFCSVVRDLVRATKHVKTPADHDAKIIVDVDLSILGQPDEVFDEYEDNIRKEYHFVPDDFFRAGRLNVLQSFLDRPSIYYTDFFRTKYEEQARRNLQRSIEKLKRPD